MNAKPSELLKERSHYSKDYLEFRTKAEKAMRIGDHDFEEPKSLFNNNIAINKWYEIVNRVKEYGFEFITSHDSDALAIYCNLYAEWQALTHKQNRYIAMGDIDIDLCTQIDRKVEKLVKLSDKLLLNPLSRIKTVPKKQEKSKQDDDLEKLGFGNL